MMHRRSLALDGIRGFAVLWVVLFHATNSMGHSSPYVRAVLAVLHQGWFGVEVFFALSGFLITNILLESKALTARDYFAGFYWRRVLRIFPIYFLILALLALVPLAVDALQTPDWHRYIEKQWWFWLFGSNIVWAYYGTSTPVLEFGWFELTHTWSLAVEEHFYLLWPLLVFVLNRRALWVAVASVFCVSVALHFTKFGPLATGLLDTPKHLTGLSLGAILAMWRPQIPAFMHPLVRLCEARWLVFFGTYSYGLYLLHNLFTPLWRTFNIATWPGGYSIAMIYSTVIYVGLPLLVAMASFHWIERPILRYRGLVGLGRRQLARPKMLRHPVALLSNVDGDLHAVFLDVVAVDAADDHDAARPGWRSKAIPVSLLRLAFAGSAARHPNRCVCRDESNRISLARQHPVAFEYVLRTSDRNACRSCRLKSPQSLQRCACPFRSPEAR